ncbi:hypothetical protein Ahy_A08g038440 isoform E [Arachis hypogaea]|uniref:Uncharacterized protein n=1 Tax=Arachis hypogaea TaxID=3818 RepID=A0A445BTR2_ARAHY|nr:hypothetical protein Ahy_A08g038440 isoform E [Arachis hypogaea]
MSSQSPEQNELSKETSCSSISTHHSNFQAGRSFLKRSFPIPANTIINPTRTRHSETSSKSLHFYLSLRTSFHFLHLSVLKQLLIEHHLWILINQITTLIISILQEHNPVHLSPRQIKCPWLLQQHMVSMLCQTKLFLELHKVVN